MQLVLQLDEVTLKKLADEKRRHRRTRRKLQLAEVRIDELEAENDGLRNALEWSEELRLNPDLNRDRF